MAMNFFCPTASALVLGVSLLSACSSGDPAAKTPAPPQKTVFDPLVQTEQRARDGQKTIDENAERTRKATDAEERGDSSP
jgi:hypothetical protein